MLAAGLMPAAHVQAQDADQGDTVSGYRTGEHTPRNDQPFSNDDSQATAKPTDPKTQGPVRLARFAYVHGNVTWRPDSTASWSKATNNMPLRQGAEIWVTEGGRADLQFDDGSALRLGNRALAVLKVLYSDAQGEFTEIALNDGLATLHSRHADAVYQVDTPMASVKSSGVSQVRFGVDGGSEIAVQTGSATVEGAAGKTTVEAGHYLYLRDANSAYTPHKIPGADSWDQWNSDRNRLIEGKSETYRHVPSNIGLVAEDLDSSGSWHEDSKYGWVWAPRVTERDWRPYYYGHWTWVDPFGWTWVSDESWGWAPYHYGTWVELSYGWSWCPGSQWQYWSPGVVSFCSYGDRIGWAPLCPWEVRYPSAFSLGYWGGNWGLSFSIGWAGCYYPSYGGFCEGRSFDNYYVNRWNGDDRFNNGNGYRYRPGTTASDRLNASAEGHVAVNSRFVPYNASHSAGTTYAANAAFNGRGTYQAAAKGDTSFFNRGQAIGAPAGKAAISGPTSIQPTSLSRTSTRAFTADARPSQSALQRSLYQAQLPSNVQRSLPATQTRRVDVMSRTSATAGGAPGSPIGRTSPVESGLSSGRSRPGFSPASPDHSTVTTANSSSRSPAEAARQARASLGMDGTRSSSEFSRGGDRSGVTSGSAGSNGDRTSGSYRNGSGGDRSYPGSGRNSPGAGSPPSAGHSYGGSSRGSDPGSAPRSYRVGPSDGGGSGGRSSGSSGGSGGGRSSGSSDGGAPSGGSSGGGRSSGGGSPFNRGR